MPDATEALLLRLIGGHPAAATEILERAPMSTSPDLLVAAAVLTHRPEHLQRAEQHAASTRDRQLVALARTHLRGDTERLDALVRDHLAEHPDHLLASWLAGTIDRSTG